jgi:hypothetical protein
MASPFHLQGWRPFDGPSQSNSQPQTPIEGPPEWFESPAWAAREGDDNTDAEAEREAAEETAEEAEEEAGIEAVDKPI